MTATPQLLDWLALIGCLAFAGAIYLAIRLSFRWTEQARKAEREFQNQNSIRTPDESGNTITIINEKI